MVHTSYAIVEALVLHGLGRRGRENVRKLCSQLDHFIIRL